MKMFLYLIHGKPFFQHKKPKPCSSWWAQILSTSTKARSINRGLYKVVSISMIQEKTIRDNFDFCTSLSEIKTKTSKQPKKKEKKCRETRMLVFLHINSVTSAVQKTAFRYTKYYWHSSSKQRNLVLVQSSVCTALFEHFSRFRWNVTTCQTLLFPVLSISTKNMKWNFRSQHPNAALYPN